MEFFNSFCEGEDFATIFSKSKVVKVIRKNITSIDNSGEYFKNLASKIGTPLVYEENPVTGEIIHNKWTEIKYDKAKSKNTYKHSSKAQPLHTDYGYFSFDMLVSFFYCELQAEFGGATTFIDVDRVVKILQETDNQLLLELQRTKIQFGRNDSPLASRKDFIIRKDEVGWKINWNYYRAKSDTANETLINRFKNFLDEKIEKSGELLSLKLCPGEGVFFHDRRVLHGRNSFVGNRHLNKGALMFEVPKEIVKLLKTD